MAESPSPIPNKRKKTKSGKASRRIQELVEEEKEGEVYKSSVRTRSALKALRTERLEADSVASQLAAAKLGAGDQDMNEF